MESGWPEARCMVRKIPKVRRMRTGRKKQSLRSLTVMKMDVSNVSEYTSPSRVHICRQYTFKCFHFESVKVGKFTQGFPLLPAITAYPRNTIAIEHTHIKRKKNTKKEIANVITQGLYIDRAVSFCAKKKRVLI
jgi:hypothetical protein